MLHWTSNRYLYVAILPHPLSKDASKLGQGSGAKVEGADLTQEPVCQLDSQQKWEILNFTEVPTEVQDTGWSQPAGPIPSPEFSFVLEETGNTQIYLRLQGRFLLNR